MELDSDQILAEQEEIIQYVQGALKKMQLAEKKQERDQILYDLLAFLISSSNDIAQKGDYYEAAGRLYSAAYYLEEYKPQQAEEIYRQSAVYYENYYQTRLSENFLEEAASIALKIANLYEKHLIDVATSHRFIRKAIQLIIEHISKLDDSGPTKPMLIKYQKIAILYAQIHEWNRVIEYSRQIIQPAQDLQEYTILANAFRDMASAYIALNQNEMEETVRLEALDYFSQELDRLESIQQIQATGQILQIVKSFALDLNNNSKFIEFSRKEARIFIQMADAARISKNDKRIISSYYRGAALCYRETQEKRDLLDAASCFYLAGNYARNSKNYHEAALNYSDAADLFMRLDDNEKAFDLAVKAGENALKSTDFEFAVDQLLWASEMVDSGAGQPGRVRPLLVKHLLRLAKRRTEEGSDYDAGCLRLEAATQICLLALSLGQDQPSLHFEGYEDPNQLYCSILLTSANDFLKFSSKHEESVTNLPIVYSQLLGVLIYRYLQDKSEYLKAKEKLQIISGLSQSEFEPIFEKIYNIFDIIANEEEEQNIDRESIEILFSMLKKLGIFNLTISSIAKMEENDRISIEQDIQGDQDRSPLISDEFNPDMNCKINMTFQDSIDVENQDPAYTKEDLFEIFPEFLRIIILQRNFLIKSE